MKTCTKCLIIKNPDDFGNRKSSPDGKRSRCNTCHLEDNQAYAERHREKTNAYKKKWRNENEDAAKIVHREWYYSNIDKVRNKARSPSNRYCAIKREHKRFPGSEVITLDEYCHLIKNPCSYCGDPLPEAGRGLDRLDSLQGYHKDNVVPCCTVCNSIKMHHSVEFLKTHVTKFLNGLVNVITKKRSEKRSA